MEYHERPLESYIQCDEKFSSVVVDVRFCLHMNANFYTKNDTICMCQQLGLIKILIVSQIQRQFFFFFFASLCSYCFANIFITKMVISLLFACKVVYDILFTRLRNVPFSLMSKCEV